MNIEEMYNEMRPSEFVYSGKLPENLEYLHCSNEIVEITEEHVKTLTNEQFMEYWNDKILMTQEEFDKLPLIEQILYDETGMLVDNHPSIAEAMEKYHQAKLKLLGIADVSGSTIDFQDDLFVLINKYVDAGLKKSDLIHLMEYATESCRLS